MDETWFEKQERQRREYILRRLEYLETSLRLLQRRLEVNETKHTRACRRDIAVREKVSRRAVMRGSNPRRAH